MCSIGPMLIQYLIKALDNGPVPAKQISLQPGIPPVVLLLLIQVNLEPLEGLIRDNDD